jgi:hypothetical protein
VLIGGAQVKAKNVSNDGIPLERQSYMGWNWGIRIRSPMPFIVGISMSGSNPRDGQIWWNKKYYAWFFGATIEIADQVAYWDDWCMWLWKL